MTGAARLIALVALAGLLAGCMTIDWQRTGQMWVGGLCDSWSHCSYDADGDPYTLQ